jgi:SAM-dependent methyltransferase
VTRRDPYRVFSLVYDQDLHLDIPREFFRTLRPWLRAAPRVLELGCGSGLLTERIAAAGGRVLGIDGSRAMLDRARRRCARHARRVELREGDLTRLRLAPVHALAVACHDVVNHLPTQAALRRALTGARCALAPGGVLVFDALTDWAFATYWSENTHRLEGADGEVWMECDWDAVRRRGTVQLTAYVRAGRGRYARHTTTLHEYAWSDRELVRALRAAGFAEVWLRRWSPWSERDGSRPERALWCARVAGEGLVSTSAIRARGFRRVLSASRSRFGRASKRSHLPAAERATRRPSRASSSRPTAGSGARPDRGAPRRSPRTGGREAARSERPATVWRSGTSNSTRRPKFATYQSRARLVGDEDRDVVEADHGVSASPRSPPASRPRSPA